MFGVARSGFSQMPGFGIDYVEPMDSVAIDIGSLLQETFSATKNGHICTCNLKHPLFLQILYEIGFNVIHI
jgi:hypothetical protein